MIDRGGPGTLPKCLASTVLLKQCVHAEVAALAQSVVKASMRGDRLGALEAKLLHQAAVAFRDDVLAICAADGGFKRLVKDVTEELELVTSLRPPSGLERLRRRVSGGGESGAAAAAAANSRLAARVAVLERTAGAETGSLGGEPPPWGGRGRRNCIPQRA